MRSQIEIFDAQFGRIHSRSAELVRMVPAGRLYERPRQLPQTFAMFSCGEYILRSAASVEQTFGGIMTKLWDDPFEWTLPEALPTNELVLNYLDEAEDTRLKGFAFLTSDDDLRREIPALGGQRSIFEILLETVARAEHFQGRAFSVFQHLSDDKLPRR